MPNEGLTGNLHRQRFTHLPTPIEELPNLRQYLLDSRGPDKKYEVPRLLVVRRSEFCRRLRQMVLRDQIIHPVAC